MGWSSSTDEESRKNITAEIRDPNPAPASANCLVGLTKAWMWVVNLFHGPESTPATQNQTALEGTETSNETNLPNRQVAPQGNQEETENPWTQSARVSPWKVKKLKRATRAYRVVRHANDWVPIPPERSGEAESYSTAMAVPQEERSDHQQYIVETFFGQVVDEDAIYKHEVVTQSEEYLEVENSLPLRGTPEESAMKEEALGNIKALKYCRRESWGVLSSFQGQRSGSSAGSSAPVGRENGRKI